ncbi:MAG: transposase, partial [Nanoarchaeota archaeon]|nr:transposase [Nanoarchaeota archaeon]
RQFVAYKVERTGKHYMTVNYRGTTQRCSSCGKTVAKELAERVHKCPFCSLEIPRDHNSALEVKNLMLKELKIGQELSESTPTEMEALRPVMVATSVEEIGSLFQNPILV